MTPGQLRTSAPLKRSRLRPQSRKRAGLSRCTIKQLDELWREAVRLRDGNCCQWPGCGKTEYVQCHHVYSCSIYALRWEPRNGVALCRGHHFSIAHQRSRIFDAWWTERVGATVANHLDIVARMRNKPKVDREGQRLFLTMEIKRLEAA